VQLRNFFLPLWAVVYTGDSKNFALKSINNDRSHIAYGGRTAVMEVYTLMRVLLVIHDNNNRNISEWQQATECSEFFLTAQWTSVLMTSYSDICLYEMVYYLNKQNTQICIR